MSELLFGIRDSRSASKGINVIGSVLTSDDLGRDRQVQTDLVRCAHCGAHGVHRKGCGAALGWCGPCHAPLCPRCAAVADRAGCVPNEQLLENMEAGLPFEAALRRRPTRVSVGGVLWGA